MSDKKPVNAPPGMAVEDVYFILFRRKWLIVGLSLAGFLAAAAVCIIKPPQYQSEAELSVRYVVESKNVGAPGEETRDLNERVDSIISTEAEILLSLDLAEQVVQAMTPEKILAASGGGSDTNKAAYLVKKSLMVETTPGSSLIHITFRHPDPDIVQPALYEIIDGYYKKHVEMHTDVSGSFLTNETVRLRSELASTDEKLRAAQAALGVISIPDAKKDYSDRISKLKSDILSAEGELTERQATMKAMAIQSTTGTNGETIPRIPTDQYDAYRRICARLAILNKKEDDYLTLQGFTADSVLVKEVQTQIGEAQKVKVQLEGKYSQLTNLDIPLLGASSNPSEDMFNGPANYAQLAGLKSKIEVLKSQLSQVWVDATNFQNVEATISELQQRKDLEESNLKYFETSLEKSRIDDALTDRKPSNISVIQEPTPPLKGWSKVFKKKVASLAAGGVLAGLLLAFILEMVLDRSVKRPSEIENKLRLPLFISIPDMKQRKSRGRLPDSKRRLLTDAADAPSAQPPTENGVAPWDRKHPLRKFYEGLRDRLIVNFEVNEVLHNPKLIAVTSCNQGAGVSSIAAGLAASLSETGDGNVLLVNISGDQGAAHQFHKGKLGCSLDEALENGKKENALVRANLYAASEQGDTELLPANLPKKIAGLMPKLKTSQYDYIIFDMPPVNQTSVTARLSGLMDKVLLVIESEKTNQEVVKRVNKLLGESKANVSAVLNKAHNYVPAKLHQEFLNDT